MSQQRPTLKLKLTTSHPLTTPGASDSVATPVSASGKPKIKLKLGSKNPDSPLTTSSPSLTLSQPASDPKALKSALKRAKKEKLPPLATGKPNPKKRDHTTALITDELDTSGPATAPLTASGIKKIKLTTSRKTPTTPFIRVKAKGKPPHRPLGVGYDSEASDREEDPAIEEEFILRMIPGPDCEYIRTAIAEKRFGPRSQGGADVRLKFLRPDGRRAVVIVRGKIYAASLVDLPCVIEGMKSWDRRGWWKTADICQMLLVLGMVNSEAEAMEYPLPGKELDKVTWQYAHGLTPPMRWVRKRRFRKRVSNRTIEAVEEEVERLLRLDDECEGESRYEHLDLDRLSRGQSGRAESEYGSQDARGEADKQSGYFDDVDTRDAEADAEAEDDGLAADLERAMMATEDNEADGDQDPAEDSAHSATTPAARDSSHRAFDPAPRTDSDAGTPAAGITSRDDSGDSSSSSSDDDDDDDNDSDDDNADLARAHAAAAEIDEDVLEQQADLQRQREEIADLEAAIRSQTAEYERQANLILKKKISGKIQSLKTDLELKMVAVGEGGD
ncbi:hypothetical protein MMC19_003075 [Ptychographa xylographoides]|nr:hypothetical protein [Ptychographa xylographoides]